MRSGLLAMRLPLLTGLLVLAGVAAGSAPSFATVPVGSYCVTGLGSSTDAPVDGWLAVVDPGGTATPIALSPDPGLVDPWDCAVDPTNGDVIVVDEGQGGGGADGAVYRVDVDVSAGTGAVTTLSSGVLINPRGVVVDGAGVVYVSDDGPVFAAGSNDGAVYSITAGPTLTRLDTGGPALDDPSDLDVDPRPYTGTSPGVNLLVLERAGRLDRVPVGGGTVVTVDGLGGSGWWDGLEVGPMDKVFLVDLGGSDVVRWDRDTGATTDIASPGSGFPLGVTVDYTTGDLVVADAFGDQVMNVPPNAYLAGAPGPTTIVGGLPGLPAGVSFSPPLPDDSPSANFGVPTRRAPAGTFFMNMGPTAGVANGDTEFEQQIFIEVTDTSDPLRVRIFDANAVAGYDEPRTGGFDSDVRWTLYDPSGAIVTRVAIPAGGRVDLDQRIATLNAGNTLTVGGPGVPLAAPGLYRLEMAILDDSDVNQFGVWVEDFHAYTYHAGFGPLDTIGSAPTPRATTFDPARFYPYQDRGCEFTVSNYDMDFDAGTGGQVVTREGEAFPITVSGFTVHAEDTIDPSPASASSSETDQGLHRLEVDISPAVFGNNNLVTVRAPDFQGWADDDGAGVDAPVPPGAPPTNPTPAFRSSPGPAWPPAGAGANTFLRMYLPRYHEVLEPVSWAARAEPYAPFLSHSVTPLAGDPPSVGSPSTYAVHVTVTNPDPVHATGALTLTVPVPAPALYVESGPNVGGAATATGGGTVGTCGAPCSGTLTATWAGGIAPGSAETFSYAVQVTPSFAGERLYLTGGPAARGGGGSPAANAAPTPGTTALFTPAWSSATFPRTESLGPLCDLSLVEGTVTPVAVELSRLEAIPGDGEVLLAWETASEIDNLGFRVHRRLAGEEGYRVLTPTPILGRGTTDLAGRYAFHDTDAPNGVEASYLLEDLEFDGDTGWHGPVAATPAAGAAPLAPDPAAWHGFAASTGSAGSDAAPPADLAGDAAGLAPDDGGGDAGAPASASVSAPAGPDLRVLESTGSHVTVEIRLPPVETREIVAEGATWTRVEAPGFAASVLPGLPELPARTFWVPAREAPSYRLADVQREGATRTLAAPVVPVPTPGLVGSEVEARLEPDPATYLGGEPVPAAPVALVASPPAPDGGRLLGLRVHPARFTGAQGTLEVDSRLVVRVALEGSPAVADASAEPIQAAPEALPLHELAAMPGVELRTRGAGLFAVSGAELLAAGLDPAVDPRRLELTREGEPVPVHLAGEDDGVLDPDDRLWLHTEGYADRYTDEEVFRFVEVGAPGLRAGVEAAPPQAPAPAASVQARSRFEEQRVYLPTVLNGEGDNFVGSFVFDRPVTSVVPSPAARAEDALLHVKLRGGTSYEAIPEDHHVTVRVDGEVVLDAVFDGTEAFEGTAPLPAAALGDDALEVEVHPEFDSGAPFDLVYVDALELDYRRAPQLRSADAGQLAFTAEADGPFAVGGLADPVGARVWDVTDPAAPRVLQGLDATAGTLTFEARAGRRYAVVDGGAAGAPASVAFDVPSDWTDPEAGHGADWLAIAHGSLLPELAPLAAQRRAQGLATAVVDVDDVYDEMRGGRFTPEAIRDFVRRVHATWSPAPRYLLLVGDASYDYRDFLGGARGNLVPTMLVDTTFVEAASDTDLVRLDDDDAAPDLAVGRLPVETADQLRDLVGKILAYENAPDAGEAWRRRVLLVADDGLGASDPVEGEAFESALDGVADHLPPSFAAARVELSALPDATEAADANAAIRAELAAGAALAVYAGHGGARLWADELVFGADDFDTLPNAQWPLFLVLNCLNGFFDAPNEEAFGEVALEAPDRGGVAVVSSTTVSALAGQDAFASALAERLLAGNVRPVGDAVLQALQALAGVPGAEDVQRSYVLLGDPATPLGMPRVPVADAGPAVEVRYGEAVVLDGSGSQAPGGGPLAFDWSVETEPAPGAARIQPQDDPARPLFVGLEPGTYTLALRVTDPEGVSGAPDTVQVSVTPGPGLRCGGGGPAPPPAAAGGDLLYFAAPLLASASLGRRLGRRRGRARRDGSLPG